MSRETELWRMRRPGRTGVFGKYSVQGFQFESASGELAWQVSEWGDYGPVKSYWVANRRFYGVIIHFNGAGDNRIETFPEIRDLPGDEKEAVLAAIATWEKPNHPTPAASTSTFE